MGCKPGKPAARQGENPPGGTNLPSKNVKSGGIAHASFIIDNEGKILDSYDLDKKRMGEGSYGYVCRAVKKDKGKQIRAVKTISKAQMKNLVRFQQEIAIMKMMDHPNIIKLFESFQDHRNIYLVMELAEGGELFDRIIDAGHFNEGQAATLMRQLVLAIHYMHSQSVCHRDLKPENFLFMTKDPIEKSTLKIIDFGLSCKYEPNQVLATKAGTPYYVAPQVLAGKYNELSDVWSLGVIMYVMLCGYPPFYGETDAEVLSKVRLGNFSFNAADWKNISEDAKTLIRMMLKMSPKERYTAEQALNHEWIKSNAPKSAGVSLQSNFVDHLRGFRSHNKLKKAALHVIAGQLNEDQIKTLRETFMALDADGDGQLTKLEMKEGLEKAGLKEIPTDLQQAMEDADSDGSGVIDYTEFLAATLDCRTVLEEDVCWQAFRVFDKNGDGQISQTELAHVFDNGDVKNVFGSDALKAIMKDIDADGDGQINFTEFMQMMRANK